MHPERKEIILQSIKRFGFWRDIGVMFQTVFAVLGKEYKDERPVSREANEQ